MVSQSGRKLAERLAVMRLDGTEVLPCRRNSSATGFWHRTDGTPGARWVLGQTLIVVYAQAAFLAALFC